MTQGKRIALVSGANRGLGFEISRQLGQRGVTVIMGARDQAKGEAAVETLRAESLDASLLLLDMSESESLANAADYIADRFGRLDVLVNNAAVLSDIGVQPSDTDEKILRDNFDINFFGPFILTRNLTPLLAKSDSACILNLATQVATFNNLSDPESPLLEDICPAYQASKIALNAMTALFAKEFRNQNIKVNSVCPGWVMTDMGHEDLPDYGDAVRPMTVEEAVAKLLWLTELPADGPTGGFFSEGQPCAW